ncbi:MAG: 3,4-dihydroxy-2-butanone-4-phosphate synthase [Actinobacteria bacterium]|nr:3,4-dihydroxy-2-butanone-4-phosphate synthase [Actinomycetota bacterium]
MKSPKLARAVADLAAGRLVIVVDDLDRENEGDLVIAAERVTPEAINFMAREGRGLICVAMTGERLDELGLPLQVAPGTNTALLGTAFTVSVDAIGGATTGISAFDRARTVRALVDPHTKPSDLARPGHVFPLRAHPNGVLGRRGQTEAGVDLAQLAGLRPAAVICEIMAPDGRMAKGTELEAFAALHDLAMTSVEELAVYRRTLRPANPPPAPASRP